MENSDKHWTKLQKQFHLFVLFEGGAALSTWHALKIRDNCLIKMGSVEKLPVGWIRKESRSRPNSFYYFNTTTGTSQWHSPAVSTNEKSKEIKSAHKVHKKENTTTTTTKGDEKTKPHSSENQTRLKINDKSKDRK